MADLLLVDDDAISSKVIAATLARGGHTVATADDGQAGLEAAIARLPALIVTDVIMPRMDGWRFVQALRADPRTALLPVVFLTILREEHFRVRGFGLGADDYIAKPVNSDELLFRVERSLRRADSLELAARHGLGARAAFIGDVSQLGPAALLSLLTGERKSGELRLTRRDGEVVMVLRNGVIAGARSDPARGLRGVDAVYDALGWWSGMFEFVAGEQTAPLLDERVQDSFTYILMEAARRFDEQAAGPQPRR